MMGCAIAESQDLRVFVVEATAAKAMAAAKA
jgi:hypothetical protein